MMLSVEDEYPDRWDAKVEPLAAWVADARELEFEHPVYVNFLSPAEYTAAASVEGPATEEGDDDLADVVSQMRALGLVTGEVDLTESVNTLNGSGTLAFYRPSDKQIYVRGTSLTPAVRVTLVHELVHVLQDQHFDLGRNGDPEGDPFGTLRAVAEGDAGRIEDQYAAEELSGPEREAVAKDSEESGQEAADEVAASVPEGLTAVFAAPYMFGEPFVAHVAADDGNAGMDEALSDPPSSRVLFDPRLWGTPEATDLDVSAQVPAGTEELDSDRLGSPILYMVLASRLPAADALTAVDAVGGERYVAYRDGSRVCTRTVVKGRDAAATSTLEGAFERWAEVSPADTTKVSNDAGSIMLQTCDPGPDAEFTAVTLDSLALPVGRIDLFAALRTNGTKPAVASCVVDKVIPALTSEQISGADPEAEAAIAGVVAGAAGSCAGAS